MNQNQSQAQKIRSVVQGWKKQIIKVPQQSHVILILGYKFIGKSSFCALCSQHNQIESNIRVKIQTDKQKYVLPGIISNSSVKSVTLLPKIYKVGNVFLLDAPSMVLPQQSSKKTTYQIQTLQGKIACQLMLKSFQKMSFILTVNEALTKTKLDGLKRMVIGFVEYFQQPLSQSLMNSVGFLFTKVPPGLDQQKMINRIVKLIPQFKNHDRSKEIQSLINKIISNKAITLFFKVESQEKDKNLIPKMFNEITAIKHITRSKDQIKIAQLNINATQTSDLKTYWGNIQCALRQLKGLFKKVESNEQNLTQLIEQTKTKITNSLTQPLPQSNIYSHISSEIFAQNPIQHKNITLHQILIMSIKIIKTINMSQFNLQNNRKQQQNPIVKVFKIFSDYKIIDQQTFGLIKEIVWLYLNISSTFHKNQINLLQKIDEIKNFFSEKQYQNIRSQLTSKIQQKRQVKYYQQLVQALQYFKKYDEKNNQTDDNIVDLIIQCELEIGKGGDPSEFLKRNLDAYQKSIQNKRQNNIHIIYINVANLLEKFKLYKYAFRLFQQTDPYKAIQCINKLMDEQQTVPIDDIKQYAIYFLNIGLREKCLQFCYCAGHKLSTIQDRKSIFQVIQMVLKKKSDNLNITIRQGFEEFKVQLLQQHLLKQLRSIQSKLQQNKIKSTLRDTKETVQQV